MPVLGTSKLKLTKVTDQKWRLRVTKNSSNLWQCYSDCNWHWQDSGEQTTPYRCQRKNVQHSCTSIISWSFRGTATTSQRTCNKYWHCAGMHESSTSCITAHSFAEKLSYHRHIIRPGPLEIIQVTIGAGREVKALMTLTELRILLSFFNTVRRFVSNMSKVAAPFSKKIRKEQPPPVLSPTQVEITQ